MNEDLGNKFLLEFVSTHEVEEMGLLNLWYVLPHQKMREIIEVSFSFASDILRALRNLRVESQQVY